VMKAREMASVRSYRASGPAPASAICSSSTSGYGSSHGTSRTRSGSGGFGHTRDDAGAGRRLAERSAFRLRLVAMRYNQVRTEDLSPKSPMPCQAASIVSCRTSSASATEPRIR
jgi:hypothetical protein